MEIGILTFWETRDNYGQALQGYALQTYLRSLGHKVYIIRYDHDGRYRKAKESKRKLASRLLKIIMIYPAINHLVHRKERNAFKQRLSYNALQNKLRKFDEFRNTYFQYSDQLYSTLSELQQNPPKADVYIVGSDQVWGWSLKKYDNQAFFLNFGPKSTKRIAYAPSFAMETYPESQKKILAEQLKRFDAISVRERKGVDICKSVGFYAEWVCDPTMLLKGDDYRKISSEIELKDSYIFIYSLNIKEEEEIKWSQIKELSKITGYNIKVTVSSGHIAANELFDGVIYDYATVEGWLSDIENASFVVTTSFHGVVLCILMNKNFAFVPLRGEYAKGNNRVTDLLEMLKLNGHIVTSQNTIKHIYENKTNWEKTNEIIDTFRLKSHFFITEGLKK